jgi:hypothetical protein
MFNFFNSKPQPSYKIVQYENGQYRAMYLKRYNGFERWMNLTTQTRKTYKESEKDINNYKKTLEAHKKTVHVVGEWDIE